jgi:hypothetical protein
LFNKREKKMKKQFLLVILALGAFSFGANAENSEEVILCKKSLDCPKGQICCGEPRATSKACTTPLSNGGCP